VESISEDLRRHFAEKKLEQDLDSLNLKTSARTYDDGRTRYINLIFLENLSMVNSAGLWLRGACSILTTRGPNFKIYLNK